jgi:hypothetical protein
VDAAVETDYHDNGTLASISASATCDDSDLTVEQRVYAVVGAARSLHLHAHNDLDLLVQAAPDDASALTDEQH